MNAATETQRTTRELRRTGEPLVLRRADVDKADAKIMVAVFRGGRTLRDIADYTGTAWSNVAERISGERRAKPGLGARGYVCRVPGKDATILPGPRLAGVYFNRKTGEKWPLEYA